jgi:hypothetical protein
VECGLRSEAQYPPKRFLFDGNKSDGISIVQTGTKASKETLKKTASFRRKWQKEAAQN